MKTKKQYMNKKEKLCAKHFIPLIEVFTGKNLENGDWEIKLRCPLETTLCRSDKGTFWGHEMERTGKKGGFWQGSWWEEKCIRCGFLEKIEPSGDY